MQHARDSSDTSLFPVLFSHSLYISIINPLLNKSGLHLRRQLCFRRARLPLFNEDGKKNSELNLSFKLRVTSRKAMHWFKTQTFNSSAHIKAHFAKPTQPTAGWIILHKPWQHRVNKSALSRTSSLDNPPCLVATGKHNPLWQEHKNLPELRFNSRSEPVTF